MSFLLGFVLGLFSGANLLLVLGRVNISTSQKTQKQKTTHPKQGGPL